MRLKAKLLMWTAGFALMAGVASAAITANDVVKSYQDAAYTRIEVVEGPSQIKVEAIKDGMKIEVIYDKATGDVLKTESHAVAGEDADQSGVEIKRSGDDFADVQGHDATDDDQAGDDHGNDDQAGDDDGNDDHSGAGEDESDDDHGGDDHSGSGGSGHDDHEDNDHEDESGSDD